MMTVDATNVKKHITQSLQKVDTDEKLMAFLLMVSIIFYCKRNAKRIR